MGSPVSPKALDIVCSPREHAPLRIVSEPSLNGEPAEFLCNGERGLRFPIRGGVPVFVEPAQITGINVRFRGIYDRWAPWYDLLSRVGLHILGISETELRKAFVASLEIKPGDRVLSTSIGTGSDLPFLPRDCEYYGLDLSPEMLAVCERKMRRLGADAELFLGLAEDLPFKDGAFDVVYQMGGINFFTDQARAIREMVRVARPGSKIVIMDETEKVARMLERVPGISAWFRHQRRPIVPPRALVPDGMEQLEYREIYDGKAWFISFRTPR